MNRGKNNSSISFVADYFTGSLSVAPVGEVFAVAVEHHQGGNLQVAEQCYRQILMADSRHADSYHLLGVIAAQSGRYDAAVTLIRQAVNLNPAVAEYHSNLGAA